MRSISFTAALVTSKAWGAHYFDQQEMVHLKMNDNNKFKVMQLTDLHLGEPGQHKSDEETLILIDSLLFKEKPDFVAITGDIVSGQGWDR